MLCDTHDVTLCNLDHCDVNMLCDTMLHCVTWIIVMLMLCNTMLHCVTWIIVMLMLCNTHDVTLCNLDHCDVNVV